MPVPSSDIRALVDTIVQAIDTAWQVEGFADDHPPSEKAEAYLAVAAALKKKVDEEDY